MKREPKHEPLFCLRHFQRGLCSLLLNRTETLATQASFTQGTHYRSTVWKFRNENFIKAGYWFPTGLSFLAHGWRSHAMGFWRHSNGNRSLTHSILINLFFKVRLNTLLLSPLLSITFVPSAFYACVWSILEGTGKAHIFSRHIIEMGFV